MRCTNSRICGHMKMLLERRCCRPRPQPRQSDDNVRAHPNSRPGPCDAVGMRDHDESLVFTLVSVCPRRRFHRNGSPASSRRPSKPFIFLASKTASSVSPVIASPRGAPRQAAGRIARGGCTSSRRCCAAASPPRRRARSPAATTFASSALWPAGGLQPKQGAWR